MRITREIETPHAPAGKLFPGVIDEDVARWLLADGFNAALENGALEYLTESLPSRGWPTRTHAEGDRARGIRPTSPHIRPVTRGAKFSVRCRSCRYRADSAVETAEGAIASVASAHDPKHTRYVAIPYPTENA